MLHIGGGILRSVLDLGQTFVARKPFLRASAVLQKMENLPLMDLDDILCGGTPMVLAPHADDESLGCGGLIAEACARGRPPVVVVLTDGTMSHPSSPSYPARRLQELREAEARRAIEVLGLPPDRIHFLCQPDARVPHDGPGMLAIAEELKILLRHWNIGTLLTTWKHDPHRDHVAAYNIGRHAAHGTGARLVCYPVWAWTLPPRQRLELTELTGARLDITRHLSIKKRAIAEHKSQYSDLIKDDPAAFRLPEELLGAMARPFEVYLFEA